MEQASMERAEFSRSVNVWELKDAESMAFDISARITLSKYMIRCLGAVELILIMELGSISSDLGINPFIVNRKDITIWTSFDIFTQKKAEDNLIEIGVLKRERTEKLGENKYTVIHEVLNSIISGEGDHECQERR